MLSFTENHQCGSKTMLTVELYNNAGVVALSLIAIPISVDHIARIIGGT
jgi:hypothetical protein